MLEKPAMKRIQQKIRQSLGLAAKGPSKRLLLKWIFLWFSLLAEGIKVGPLSHFSLFQAQLIVFICLPSHMPASSPLPFLSSLVCVYTAAAKGILLTWEPVGWQHRVDVERPTLPLPEVWPVPWSPAHSGEGGRDYISWLWKEPCPLPCMCPLGVKNKAESKWILLVDPRALLVQVKEIESPFSLLKQTSHWLIW